MYYLGNGWDRTHINIYRYIIVPLIWYISNIYTKSFWLQILQNGSITNFLYKLYYVTFRRTHFLMNITNFSIFLLHFSQRILRPKLSHRIVHIKKILYWNKQLYVIKLQTHISTIILLCYLRDNIQFGRYVPNIYVCACYKNI